jgi:hypothetical protein
MYEKTMLPSCTTPQPSEALAFVLHKILVLTPCLARQSGVEPSKYSALNSFIEALIVVLPFSRQVCSPAVSSPMQAGIYLVINAGAELRFRKMKISSLVRAAPT